jgi:hypothetical protein
MSKIPENPVSKDSDPGPSLPPDPLAREMKTMALVLSNFSDILANSIRNAISATTVPVLFPSPRLTLHHLMMEKIGKNLNLSLPSAQFYSQHPLAVSEQNNPRSFPLDPTSKVTHLLYFDRCKGCNTEKPRSSLPLLGFVHLISLGNSMILGGMFSGYICEFFCLHVISQISNGVRPVKIKLDIGSGPVNWSE